MLYRRSVLQNNPRTKNTRSSIIRIDYSSPVRRGISRHILPAYFSYFKPLHQNIINQGTIELRKLNTIIQRYQDVCPDSISQGICAFYRYSFRSRQSRTDSRRFHSQHPLQSFRLIINRSIPCSCHLYYLPETTTIKRNVQCYSTTEEKRSRFIEYQFIICRFGHLIDTSVGHCENDILRISRIHRRKDGLAAICHGGYNFLSACSCHPLRNSSDSNLPVIFSVRIFSYADRWSNTIYRSHNHFITLSVRQPLYRSGTYLYSPVIITIRILFSTHQRSISGRTFHTIFTVSTVNSVFAIRTICAVLTIIAITAVGSVSSVRAILAICPIFTVNTILAIRTICAVLTIIAITAIGSVITVFSFIPYQAILYKHVSPFMKNDQCTAPIGQLGHTFNVIMSRYRIHYRGKQPYFIIGIGYPFPELSHPDIQFGFPAQGFVNVLLNTSSCQQNRQNDKYIFFISLHDFLF